MVRESPAARVVFRIEDIERFLIPTTINTNALEVDAMADARFVQPYNQTTSEMSKVTSFQRRRSTPGCQPPASECRGALQIMA
jgi:hypothetical protein